VRISKDPGAITCKQAVVRDLGGDPQGYTHKIELILEIKKTSEKIVK
jgi:hypothetical protein